MSLLPDLSFLAILVTPSGTSSDTALPVTISPVSDVSLPVAQGHELPRADDVVFADLLPALSSGAVGLTYAAQEATATDSSDTSSQAPTPASLDALFGGGTLALGQGLDGAFDGSDSLVDRAAFGGGSLLPSPEPAAGAIPVGTTGGTVSEAPAGSAPGTAVTLAQGNADPLGAMTAQPGSPAPGTESAASVRPPAAESVPSAPALNAAQLHPALSFEANLGQTDAGVNFLAHGQGYSAFLTPTGVTLAAAGADGSETSAQIQLVGGNADATATGLNLMQARTNYLIGNDPSQWVTNVPNYGQVSYADVYPGINLVYHSSNTGGLEYDFHVSPGTDPGAIAFRVPGADSLRIAADGSLVAHTAAGDLVQTKPTIYQTGSDGQAQTVGGKFVLRPDNTVGFQVGSYDPAKELVIDPTDLWSTYVGGAGADEAMAVATDSAGNTFVAGDTNSGGGINGVPAQKVGPGGATNVLVAKFTSGGVLTWLTYLGGAGTNDGYGIAVDQADNVYVTGTTDSATFPTTAGAYQAVLRGTSDAFVTELDPTGTTAVYSTYLGGNGDETGRAIALGGGVQAPPPPGEAPVVASPIYVTGDTTSAGYPAAPVGTPGQAAYGGGGDAFVAELDPTRVPAASLVYWTYLGGTQEDSGQGIAVLNGNAYVTGYTEGLQPGETTAPMYQGMPGTPYQANAQGGKDAFFLEVNATGGFIYLTYLGGPNPDEGHAIAVDGQGIAYITGSAGNQFPITAATAAQPIYGGGTTDAFITHIQPLGSGNNDLKYSTYLGGGQDDEGNGIALATVAGLPTAFVTGDTDSGGFPAVGTWPAWGTGNNGGVDAFLTSEAGGGWVFSGFIGGQKNDFGRGITLYTPNGGSLTYVIAGDTASNPFKPLTLAWQPTYGGGINDGFVTTLF